MEGKLLVSLCIGVAARHMKHKNVLGIIFWQKVEMIFIYCGLVFYLLKLSLDYGCDVEGKSSRDEEIHNCTEVGKC